MQSLLSTYSVKQQPEMAGGVCVVMNRAVSYWYWFSHGVPLADA